MKLWTAILAAVVAVSMVGAAEAKGHKGGKAAKADGIKGKIVSVATGGNSIVVKEKSGHKKKGKGNHKSEVTVATNNETKVSGAATSVADLKAGERVKIKMKNGVAKSIKVKAAKAKHAGKGSGKKGGKKRGK